LVETRASARRYQRRGADVGRRVTGTARDRSLGGVSILNPTPPEWMVDGQGRPYFLWDLEMTLERFREQLAGDDRDVRAYLMAKLMRQAKPDDVFQFVTVAQIRADWAKIEPFLGKSRPFWTWLLAQWAGDRDAE
jgi:hypothetical protein